MEQLALQQQIELLQQQQQQIAQQQTYNMTLMPNQFQQGGVPNQMQGLSPQANMYQFPQQQQQQQMQPQQQQQQPQQQQPIGGGLGGSMHAPGQHRRNQSAMPGMAMGGGPPPAPSSGASGSSFGDFNMQGRENVNPRGRGGPPGGGHTRRHSLALPEAKKAAELAEQKRKTSAFQFPIPTSAGGAQPTSPNRGLSPASAENAQAEAGATSGRGAGGARGGHGRSQSMAVGGGRGVSATRGGPGFTFPVAPNNNQAGGHARTGSRNFESNWRQQQNNGQPNAPTIQEQQPSSMGSFNMNAQGFQPGHRSRQSMASANSLANFQFPNQTQMMGMPQMMQQPGAMGGQGFNQLQLAQLQALQAAGQGMPGIQISAPGQMTAQQQQQQQRKTLFTPYLPQATLPALLLDGQLVSGILRVNKKNRSDAYVTTPDLDADIFICGSKDRNRALEGDLVAVELLDVDEVWSQKREKEEKKKRKDITDTRASNTAANDATTGGENGSTNEGGIRRRGSLRQRPTQKKNDDVEVEGQSLLLMEEEEINDEQKPLYAGHVVAVIERIAGQMFSGTLGLLRPSSQATKDKQDAERSRDGGGRQEKQPDRPKIVWFKPTDKRVPLIAIPTEQASRDFVEKHQEYANRIFVACIKRWPITSLHPFGTLVEQLGEMGDLRVETDALLRDNNFGPDDFSDAVIKSIGFDDWSVDNDGADALSGRRDYRSEETFTIDPNGAQDLDDALHFKMLDNDHVEVGVHVADVAHFIKANSLVDREAKKRGTAVYLMNRTVNMLPSRLSADICSLTPGQDRYTVSVVFQVDVQTGKIADEATWIGKSVIKSTGKVSYEEADAVIAGKSVPALSTDRVKQIQTLFRLAQKMRQQRLGDNGTETRALRLLYQLDDENVPVEANLFNSTRAHELIEEVGYRANAIVAQKLYASIGGKSWLRRQTPPNPRRMQTFAERMAIDGYEIDTASSGTLQNSLFKLDDADLRKGMEALLIKSMQRAKYCVAGTAPPEELSHFALNLPLYTHFTNPTRRYADIIVHRQLEAILSGNTGDLTEDLESMGKTAELCNTKKDSAFAAQEQSVHIESCRNIDRIRSANGGDLICEGVVLCVYESAFDVLIPEYGFEKRVHCDQLPLKKAEFDKNKRILELYWEKGVPSSAYIPEDERHRPGSIRGGNAAAERQSEATRKQQEHEETQRRNLDTGTVSTDDADALFDDDDDASGITEATAGVSLNDSAHASAHDTSNKEKLVDDGRVSNAPETKLTDKQKYLKYFTLREEGNDNIQDVKEMTRVPVILKTDLSKSPP